MMSRTLRTPKSGASSSATRSSMTVMIRREVPSLLQFAVEASRPSSARAGAQSNSSTRIVPAAMTRLMPIPTRAKSRVR